MARRFLSQLLVFVLAAGVVAAAQEAEHGEAQTEDASHAAPDAAQDGHAVDEGHSQTEIDIMHHIGNAAEIEVPYWKPPYSYAIHLPQFPPLHLGPITINLSITKHVVYLFLAALLVALIFILSGRAVARAQARGEPPRGFAGAMEAMVLYIRNEVILPNVGHHGEGFVPYLLTVFFFILTANLLGLVPWGSTATGNIAVTGALALLALIIIEGAGMRALGFKGYMGTIFFLPSGLPGWLKLPVLVIMTPVELMGKLAKPFALAVRLFANMTAGHVVVLAIIGLTFAFQSYAVGVGASVLATAIMMLELFVAFLQAYVFTLLTSVFIGLMRAGH